MKGIEHTSDRLPNRRWLTEDERALASSVFGEAITYSRVSILRRKWFPFHGKHFVMAPDGNIWFHPASPLYRPCFGQAELRLQGLFIHELVHVWQHQQGIILPLARHPFCRYAYPTNGERAFAGYGLEQQAEIVKHYFYLRQGVQSAKLQQNPSFYETILPFK